MPISYHLIATQVNELKVAHPHLKTLISIGGWSFSSPESEDAESATRMRRLDSGWTEYVFSDMVSTADNRQRLGKDNQSE